MTVTSVGRAPASGSSPAPVYRPSRTADIWPPLIAVVVAVLLVSWASGGEYRKDLVMLTATYSLIALGMYVPFVMAGSLSMAYTAYAGIGAYAVGIISERTSMTLWVGWVLGAVVSVLVAIVLSLATRRLSGFFLAAVTLLFGTAFETWLVAAEPLTGGSGGIGNIRGLTIFGLEMGRGGQIMFGAALVVVVATLIERLRRSPWGVTVRTMREVPLPVEASGVRVTTLTTATLAFGAAIASFGGSLFASFVGGVTPETFTLSIVFLAVFMPLLGGRGTAWGAVVGALLVVEISVNFTALNASGQLLISLAVLLVLLVAPAGVLGYLDRLRLWLVGLVHDRRKADA